MIKSCRHLMRVLSTALCVISLPVLAASSPRDCQLKFGSHIIDNPICIMYNYLHPNGTPNPPALNPLNALACAESRSGPDLAATCSFKASLFSYKEYIGNPSATDFLDTTNFVPYIQKLTNQLQQ